MFGVRVFATGMLIGLSSGIFVTHFHVIRTSNGFDVVPRINQPPLRSSYCDIREWSPAMWTNHPEVTAALTASGRSRLIGQNISENLLKDVLPEKSSREQSPVIDSSVAQKSLPIRTEAGKLTGEMAEPATTDTRLNQQWLEQKSSLRQKWDNMVNDGLAPIVDHQRDEEIETPPVSSPANDSMIQQLEERFRQAAPPANSSQSVIQQAETLAESIPSEVTPQAAREMLKQVIPQGTSTPRSAGALRDLGREWLNGPAPKAQ